MCVCVLLLLLVVVSVAWEEGTEAISEQVDPLMEVDDDLPALTRMRTRIAFVVVVDPLLSSLETDLNLHLWSWL